METKKYITPVVHVESRGQAFRNVELVDWFLVATGISDNFTDINPNKLTALITNRNNWGKYL
ncbi:MAG: hypothetical protein LIP09_05345 [Bacteroidales bacterium]|nr:hypothetical protein [Bacteroidales bacterium]